MYDELRLLIHDHIPAAMMLTIRYVYHTEASKLQLA